MITIYKMSDRIPVKIGDIEFSMSPMTALQKNKVIAQSIKLKSGDVTEDMYNIAVYSLKYSLKDIKGLKNSDGSDYKLKLDNGVLNDTNLDELSQLNEIMILTSVVTKWLNQGIHDPKIKGVNVSLPNGKLKNVKRRA